MQLQIHFIGFCYNLCTVREVNNAIMKPFIGNMAVTFDNYIAMKIVLMMARLHVSSISCLFFSECRFVLM